MQIAGIEFDQFDRLLGIVTAGGLPVVVSALFPGPHVVDTGLFNSGRVRPDELKKDVEGKESGSNSRSPHLTFIAAESLKLFFSISFFSM